MFKNILKALHERKSGVPLQHPPGAPGAPAYGYGAPQQQAVGGGQMGPAVNGFLQPPGSCIPVEYNLSPPTPMAGGYQANSPMPQGPVEYIQSPPVPLNPPQHNLSTVSMGPAVDYRASSPSMPALGPGRNESTQSMGPAVEYVASAPSMDSRPAPQNAPIRQQPQYIPYSRPEAPNMNNHGPNFVQVGGNAAELSAQTPQIYHPQELPASPVPLRYELPGFSPAQIHNTPSSTSSSPPLQNNAWSPASSRSTPGTTPATSPPPPAYPPTFAPNFPQQNKGSPSEAQGIIKFTVNIFCQRKAEPGMEREEIPRDVREFRLAKVALIPVVAGERRFVSLDIVFGEVDKAVAGLLEKHYLITPDSILTLMNRGTIAGNENVWKISQLKIAYKGTSSMLYMTFRSIEDETKFQVDFGNMKRVSEAC